MLFQTYRKAMSCQYLSNCSDKTYKEIIYFIFISSLFPLDTSFPSNEGIVNNLIHYWTFNIIPFGRLFVDTIGRNHFTRNGTYIITVVDPARFFRGVYCHESAPGAGSFVLTIYRSVE
jgi:hypothetical protein